MTLPEALIVIIIIAVLAAVALPRYVSQSERGVVAEAIQVLSAIRHAEEAYFLENNSYTNNLALLDVDAPPSTDFTYEVDGAGLGTAKRSEGDCINKTITLTVGGVFGGSHPFGPNPDSGASC